MKQSIAQQSKFQNYVVYQHFEIDTTRKNKVCNYLSVHKEYTSHSENKVFFIETALAYCVNQPFYSKSR